MVEVSTVLKWADDKNQEPFPPRPPDFALSSPHVTQSSVCPNLLHNLDFSDVILSLPIAMSAGTGSDFCLMVLNAGFLEQCLAHGRRPTRDIERIKGSFQ